MTIPLIDLHRQYADLKPEIDAAIQRVLDSAHFIGGPEREGFEGEYAAACGVRDCIGVGNGTDSLLIALKAMGLKAGEKVLVPANSFIASSEMVTAAGGVPVFCDVSADNFLIDLNLAEDHLRRGGIRAIMPVHLYGRMADMPAVMALASKYNLFCLEDSAQAHLASWEGRFAGSWGHAGSFSFYPGKNLGAYGDGGALTTNDEALGKKMRMLANHGRVGKYDHEFEGFNSRLDALQAAILRVKLPHLARWTSRRQDGAERYDQLLRDLPNVTPPKLPPRGQHVFHQYVIRVKNRDAVLSFLKTRGIEAGVHYPTTLPLLAAYKHMGLTAKDFPVSARLQTEIMSLPLFPEMTPGQQDEVVGNLKQAVKENP